jgi:hypothetical protein
VALWRLFVWLRDRSGILVVVTSLVVLALGGTSPVFASQGLTKIIDREDEGWIYASDDIGPGSLVRRAAEVLGPEDVVGVPVEGADRLGFLLFQFSGAKLAEHDDPQLDSNDLRIRYAELAAAWQQRVSGPGFEPDYVALNPLGPIVPGGRTVASGLFEDAVWSLVKVRGALDDPSL